jgi:hypothetical protein
MCDLLRNLEAIIFQVTRRRGLSYSELKIFVS